MTEQRGQAQLVAGILGGMGPEATIDLMQRVLAATPATEDQQHLRLLVDNNPKVPSRMAALIDGTGPSPLPELIAMARGLQAQGADFLAMPCNTAHHYHAEIASAVDLPFLNMMEIAATQLQRRRPDGQRVGLLASSALQKIELYEPWLQRCGQEPVYPAPAEQARLMDLIRAVKAGRVTARSDAGAEAFSDAARSLAAGGAQVLLIACTELSVIRQHLAASLPVLDAADLLAQAIVARARGD